MKCVFAALVFVLPFLSAQEVPDNLSGGCFLLFDGEPHFYQFCDLDIQGNGFELFYTIVEDEVEIAFRALWDGWVAFGFTAGDQKMIGSNAVIGWGLAAGGDPFPCIDDYFLAEKLPTGILPLRNQHLTSANVTYDPDMNDPEKLGYTSIMFSRPREVPGLMPITNNSFTQSIMARGPPVVQPPNGDCSMVTIKAHAHPDTDPQLTSHFVANVNFASGLAVSTVPGAYDTLIYIHQVFMAIAWGIFVPFSLVVARFFKPYKPMWFYIHRLLNTMAILLTIAAFFMGIAVFGDHTQKAHMAIGIVVFILALQQPLNAFFRPNKRDGMTRARHRWEFLHFWSGRICLALGLINVAIGMSITALITTVYIYILWLTFAAIFLLYVYFEVTGAATAPKAPKPAAMDKGNADYRAAFDLNLDQFDPRGYEGFVDQSSKLRAETA